MNRLSYLALCGALILYTSQLEAQTGFTISKPGLALKDGGVAITYDLLGAARTDSFDIRVEITDANGRIISARSLTGDVGSGIQAGRNKEIFWDLEADSIYLDEEIFVEVYAQRLEPLVVMEAPAEVYQPVLENVESTRRDEDLTRQNMETPVNQRDETQDNQTGETVLEALPPEREHSGESIKRGSVILQSLLMPGLGLSRINPGKPHWIRGAVAYGCVAGSIYLNHRAVKSYEAYSDPGSLDEVDPAFNDAVTQDVVSEVLAFAAAGIWVADLVWTLLGSRPPGRGFSLGTALNPASAVPVIAFRYRF